VPPPLIPSPLNVLIPKWSASANMSAAAWSCRHGENSSGTANPGCAPFLSVERSSRGANDRPCPRISGIIS
jgi:hypothetical protein